MGLGLKSLEIFRSGSIIYLMLNLELLKHSIYHRNLLKHAQQLTLIIIDLFLETLLKFLFEQKNNHFS